MHPGMIKYVNDKMPLLPVGFGALVSSVDPVEPRGSLNEILTVHSD